MKKNLIWYLIIPFTIAAQRAVIVVPVADLVGQPLASFYPKQKSLQQSYDDLAWAGLGEKHQYACPRLHQALLHEVVNLIEVRGEEARIRLPNIFYQTYKNNSPQCDYWTLRTNISTFAELKKNNTNTELLPKPIEHTDKNIAALSRDVVTLTHPFMEKNSKEILSAGTRFIKTPTQSRKDKVSVYVYNKKEKKFNTAYIPKKHIYHHAPRTPEKKVGEFITILRNWTQTMGTIPYVWGGCSITNAHPTNNFHEKKGTYNKYPITQIVRPLDTNTKGGVDCSGLIARAAQIVGIPYFFKNSYTITQQLELLKPNERLQAGDIIWLAGHVIVISGKDSIIEARHYDHGYGKIHEISLSEQFKDIASTTDLEKSFFQHKPLARLDNDGNLVQTYKNFKLLKLATVWK